jgi:hypothetical protein
MGSVESETETMIVGSVLMVRTVLAILLYIATFRKTVKLSSIMSNYTLFELPSINLASSYPQSFSFGHSVNI